MQYRPSGPKPSILFYGFLRKNENRRKNKPLRCHREWGLRRTASCWTDRQTRKERLTGRRKLAAMPQPEVETRQTLVHFPVPTGCTSPVPTGGTGTSAHGWHYGGQFPSAHGV